MTKTEIVNSQFFFVLQDFKYDAVLLMAHKGHETCRGYHCANGQGQNGRIKVIGPYCPSTANLSIRTHILPHIKYRKSILHCAANAANTLF